MKKIIYFIPFGMVFIINIYPQFNIIQSINFDSEGRTVYALGGEYDYSYILRYDNGNLESWNLTELFNLPFLYISSAIDNDGNIWAFMQNKIYKYDGNFWSVIDIPSPPLTYQEFSDLSYYNGYLWLSTFIDGIYHNSGVWRYRISDSTWTIFSPSNSMFPSYSQQGSFFHSGDSTWIGTSEGLVLISNDSVSYILDTSNIYLPSELIYSFFIDSNGNRWLGSFDKGLIKWVNDSTFISYNTKNSNLPNNFVNAIDEDSKGTLWLATDNGFASFVGDSITSYSYLYNNSIVTLAVDQYDKVWFGAIGSGVLYVFDGDSLNEITDVEDAPPAQPHNFALYQNYPNPFNPSTIIKYSIPNVTLSPDKIGINSVEGSRVTLKVYDMLGREIATLVDEVKPAGNYEVTFDGSKLSSGIYFYQLKAGALVETKKMILIK